MKYKIPIISGKPDWDQVETVAVDKYPWGTDYMPRTNASMILWEDGGSGIIVRMECMESAPEARYTQNGDPVYEDSCVECFLNFDPDGTDNYINLEANSNGALLCQFGNSRENRIALSDLRCAPPAVQVKKLPDRWICYFIIPMQTINALYGRLWFLPGDKFKGNFYKCGDKTAVPHYGTWNPVESDKPDFHRPECFGELELDIRR